MRRGTTPSIILKIEDYDLRDYKIIVTIQQKSNLYNITNDRLDIEYDGETNETTISFSLTQNETLNFKQGSAEIQVRAVNNEGYAVASDIGTLKFTKILFEELIDYE